MTRLSSLIGTAITSAGTLDVRPTTVCQLMAFPAMRSLKYWRSP